jgi:hypothetical protein
LLPLVRKLLAVGRPKDGDITDWINEKTFRPYNRFFADRRQQLSVRPLVEI